MGLRRPKGERASVVPVVVVVLVVAASLSGVMLRMGTGVVERARADAYADSTALAAAGGGPAAGRTVAAANGVRVVQLDRGDDGVVRVTIDHRGHRSVSAAALGGTP